MVRVYINVKSKVPQFKFLRQVRAVNSKLCIGFCEKELPRKEKFKIDLFCSKAEI